MEVTLVKWHIWRHGGSSRSVELGTREREDVNETTFGLFVHYSFSRMDEGRHRFKVVVRPLRREVREGMGRRRWWMVVIVMVVMRRGRTMVMMMRVRVINFNEWQAKGFPKTVSPSNGLLPHLSSSTTVSLTPWTHHHVRNQVVVLVWDTRTDDLGNCGNISFGGGATETEVRGDFLMGRHNDYPYWAGCHLLS